MPKPRTGLCRNWNRYLFFPTETAARIPGLPCGPHDLANEGLWSRRSAPAIADATRTDSQFIVVRRHRVLHGLGTRDGVGNVDLLCVSDESAGRRFDARPYFSLPQPLSARRTSTSLSRHPRSLCSRVVTLGLATTFENPRRNAISIIVTSSRRYGVQTGCQSRVRAPIRRPRRGREMSGSGACQPESYHRMRCRRCAPRTVKSWPGQTTL